MIKQLVAIAFLLWTFASYAMAPHPQVKKVLKDSYVEVTFGEAIETCIHPEELWSQLESSMIDSKKTWLWPNGSSKARGNGLAEDSKIKVTYGTGFFAPTYGYNLSSVIDGLTFTYTADSRHPFIGGATVSLEDGALVWSGSYLIPKNNESQRRFFERFAENFFLELRANIKKQENLNSC